MLLLLFLSLTVTCTVANNWTNETDIEYWVRPDNKLSCPLSKPPHARCVTITNLVNHFMQASTKDTVNLNVVFLPGIHVPKKSGLIVTVNPSTESRYAVLLTAKFTGLKNVLIDCESGEPIGFVFIDIFELLMKNMKLQNCGFESTNQVVALTIKNASTVLLENVSIFKSRGMGIFVNITVLNIVSIAMNKIVIDDSYGQNKSTLEGNLYIELSTSLQTTHTVSNNYVSNITITDSIISNGHCSCITECYPATCSDSGGLSLMINRSERIRITIRDCKFINNTGVNGGGFNLALYSPSTTSRTRLYNNKLTVNITSSLFLNNTASFIGGGLGVYNTRNKVYLNLSETVFTQNTGPYGSAVATFGDVHYIYTNCMFVENISEQGAALYSDGDPLAIIINCIFMRNGAPFACEKSTIFILNGQSLHIQNTTIMDNQCGGIYIEKINTALKLSGTNVIKGNHAVQRDGGGIVFECSETPSSSSPLIIIDPQLNSSLNIINNTADGYGGGIAIYSDCELQRSCFFSENIHMINNSATKGGDDIYGSLTNCNLQQLGYIAQKQTLSAVSTPPYKVCICAEDFSKTHNCLLLMQVDIYPGQRFQIPLVCTSQFNYSSYCKVQAYLELTSNAEIPDEMKLQDIGPKCTKLNYLIETPQQNYTEQLTISVVKEDLKYYKYAKLQKLLHGRIKLNIKDCPPGFALDNVAKICNCTSHLSAQGIICNIDSRKQQLQKNPSAWVGSHSGVIVAHSNCPFDYCKSDCTNVDLANQKEQCDFDRTDVLCGACRPGLSLVLGTSHCKYCSNIYLLLLIPFALVGLILVFLLLKCNITVSTGTMNGLIFYANILQATQTAFFPHTSSNKFASMLYVYVSWLNLDLGIETCFVDGLNTYYRTWLQFVFPFYIWTIVALLIFSSRYSINVSKWTGSNTVSVLATLFLLSYAKLLRTCFDTFSSITLTDFNQTTTSLWLLDGRYTFLEWPHNLLFTAGLVTLLAHVIPFTILLLTAPILQRYTHHKPLHWVNKFKPLLDAYQGPYKVKFRYWTGLLLIARLVILTAVSLNVSGNQAINLLVIIIVLTILIIFGKRKLYRSKLSNFLESFFLVNLLLLAVTSLFLQASKQADKIIGQNIAICSLVGSALATTLFILAYHCYVASLKTKAVKKLTIRVKGTKNRELGTDNDVITEVQSTPPTTSMVDLKELLLEEDYKSDH